MLLKLLNINLFIYHGFTLHGQKVVNIVNARPLYLIDI